MPILVCIGNPPYDRHEAADGRNRKETGGWVRWGDEDNEGKYHAELSLLDSFAAPVRQAGQGGQLKNLYILWLYSNPLLIIPCPAIIEIRFQKFKKLNPAKIALIDLPENDSLLINKITLFPMEAHNGKISCYL